MTRGLFADQMQNINRGIVKMGSVTEHALDSALMVLTEANEKKAESTRKHETASDMEERRIEQLCIRVLLTQQPVASDLRLIFAAMKMVTDMERIADQALDMADIALKMDRTYIFGMTKLKKMFLMAKEMLSESVNAFVNADIDLARAIIARDDLVDGLFYELKEELVNRIKNIPESSNQSIDLLLIIKYLERIGDHACNIAEWVIYALSGEYVKHLNLNIENEVNL